MNIAWNFSTTRQRGSIGTPVSDPEQPVEILRVVHSFNPCIACAVHVVDTKQDKHCVVKVA